MPSLSRRVVSDRNGLGDTVVELTLDLGLDIVDGVGRFDLEGDGLTREGLDENLHDGLVVECQLPWMTCLA